jgi:hypothetical protein
VAVPQWFFMKFPKRINSEKFSDNRDRNRINREIQSDIRVGRVCAYFAPRSRKLGTPIIALAVCSMLWLIGLERKTVKKANQAPRHYRDAKNQTNPLQNIGHLHLRIQLYKVRNPSLNLDFCAAPSLIVQRLASYSARNFGRRLRVNNL